MSLFGGVEHRQLTKEGLNIIKDLSGGTWSCKVNKGRMKLNLIIRSQ